MVKAITINQLRKSAQIRSQFCSTGLVIKYEVRSFVLKLQTRRLKASHCFTHVPFTKALVIFTSKQVIMGEKKAFDSPIGSASLFKTSIVFKKRERIMKGKIFF